MAAFPTHVFAVAIDRDLVVFDCVADRYVALPGVVEMSSPVGVDVGLPGRLIVAEAADVLSEAGLLEAQAPAVPYAPIIKPRSANAPIMDGDLRTGPGDIARFTVAMAATFWKLRRGIGCRTFVRTHRQRLDRSGLLEPLARLRDTRLVVPSPRRCLPASLIAARFLKGMGEDVDIVFGVRSHPFEAHCWIEMDGMALDDDLDRVHAFTPIAIGQL